MLIVHPSSHIWVFSLVQFLCTFIVIDSALMMALSLSHSYFLCCCHLCSSPYCIHFLFVHLQQFLSGSLASISSLLPSLSFAVEKLYVCSFYTWNTLPLSMLFNILLILQSHSHIVFFSFSTMVEWLHHWKWKFLSYVLLFATPWTMRSMEFSRSEYWSG